jgi:hypothetical protein
MQTEACMTAICLGGQVAQPLFTAYPSKGALAHARPSRPIPIQRLLIYVAFQPTRFVRMASCLTIPCALTAHFHPYSCERYFSATLSGLRITAQSHPLGGVVLYVVRTFLPLSCEIQAAVLSAVMTLTDETKC